MTRHTAEQIKAQGEIDAALGFGHLPTLSDRSRLPYVEALYAEVMRVYTFGPIGTRRHELHPHTPMMLNVTQGFLTSCPRMTFTMAISFRRALWSSQTIGSSISSVFLRRGTDGILRQFFHDPQTYQNPESFDPTRFLGDNNRAKETDPRDYLFGFGRR